MDNELRLSDLDPRGLHVVSGVLELERFSPPGSAPDRRPDLLIEIPHGATRRRDYDELRARLVSPLPAGLEQFFFVNTDIGAPEVARTIGDMLSSGTDGLSVLVARCVVPRTFVDCNRVFEDRRGGAVVDGLTPAIAGYITADEDRALLVGLHRRYQAIVDDAYAWVCGGGGLALQLHSYAPRSVRIDRIDDNIVAALHHAYEPEVYATWPQRPDVDVISATADGTLLASRPLIDALRRRYAELGISVQENATYHMHPATTGCAHARRWPERVLCVELSRGLLADPFQPFAESAIGPSRVAHMAPPIAEALRERLAAR